jgi:hypothetical protein
MPGSACAQIGETFSGGRTGLGIDGEHVALGCSHLECALRSAAEHDQWMRRLQRAYIRARAVDFAKTHEAAGFDMVLVGYTSSSAEGFLDERRRYGALDDKQGRTVYRRSNSDHTDDANRHDYLPDEGSAFTREDRALGRLFQCLHAQRILDPAGGCEHGRIALWEAQHL